MTVVEKKQPLLSGKLHPPSLRNVLTRPRLIELANIEHKRLINICAGPGYGKTTLMAQLVEKYEGPKIWYQVDYMDQDPAVFLRHLIVGFAAACDGAGERSLSRMADATNIETEGENILAVLLDEVREKSTLPIRLCIDDYHLIDECKFASKFLHFIFRHLPEDSTIVLTSRSQLRFPLGRIRSFGQLLEIKETDLRFSLNELQQFMNKKCSEVISENDVALLLNKTEGWVAGLVLAENFFEQGKDVIPDLFSNHQLRTNVYEYLAEEVLDGISESQIHLLMKCSLMDTINPEICKSAFNESSSLRLFRTCEKLNIFVSRVEDTDLYRFHPLFKEFLQDRLEDKTSKKEVCTFRITLGSSLEGAGAIKAAMEQYSLGESAPDMLRLVEESGEDLLTKGEYVTLERWLDSIDGQELTAAMLMLKGRLQNLQGKNELAIVTLDNSRERIEIHQIEAYTKCSLSIAECFADMGKKKEAVEELEPLLDLPISRALRMEVLYSLGTNHWPSFDFKKVNYYCSKAKELADLDRSESILFRARGLEAIQLLYLGDFQKATKIYRELLNSPACSASLRKLYQNNLASCLMLVGKYREACEIAEPCLAVAEEQRENRWMPMILDTYGCSLISRGEYEVGEAYLVRARDFTSSHGGKKSAEFAVLCHLGTLARRKGANSSAYEQHKRCLNEALEMDELYDCAMSMANVGADLIRMDRIQEAELQLNNAEDLARRHKFHYVLTNVDFHRAWAAHNQLDSKGVLRFLRSAFRRASKLQHNHFMIQEGKISLPLLAEALSHKIEPEYVSLILTKIGSASLQVLQPLLSHHVAAVRRDAITLIGGIGGRNAETLLGKAVRDEEKSNRSIAKDLLSVLRQDTGVSSDLLSRREKEILSLLATGVSNRQIAGRLYISEATVKTHVNHILRKLGLKNRIEAALYFHETQR